MLPGRKTNNKQAILKLNIIACSCTGQNWHFGWFGILMSITISEVLERVSTNIATIVLSYIAMVLVRKYDQFLILKHSSCVNY